MTVRSRVLMVAAFASLTIASAATAQWIPQGRAVSSSVGSHNQPALVPDGAGGAYVVWQYSGPSTQEVYVAHVLANGGAGTGFGALGSPVSSAAGPRFLHGAGPDGSGGLVVGWAGAGEFAQRFQSDGTPAAGWSANGNELSLPYVPRSMAADGVGGGWFMVRDDWSFCPDICYQGSFLTAYHFTGAGLVNQGPIGIASSNYIYGAFGEFHPSAPGSSLVSTFWDSFAGTLVGLDASGSTWSYSLDVNHLIVWDGVSDGSGGGLVVTQGAYGSLGPRLLRIDANGSRNAAFTAEGAVIRVPDVEFQSAAATASDAGSIVIAWTESAGVYAQVRAQKLTGTGAVAAGWPADGVVVCDATGGRDQVVIASDGAGGAFLAWHDRRNEQAGDVYAHHVLSDGTLDPAFVTNGTGIATVSGGVNHLRMVPVTDGEVMLAWTDFRTFSEIRAQKLPLPGSAGVGGGAGRFALAGFVPNPAPALPRVAFTLAAAGDATLELFDLAGRRVHEERWSGLAAGPHQLALSSGRSLPPGLYLIRLRANGEQSVRRGLVSH